MTDSDSGFDVGIDFEHVLAAISKQIYETPLAFLRENVQNAVDAVRIQAVRDGRSPGDESYRVNVDVDGQTCTVSDNGIGMTRDDLRRFYWTIGASGKRTAEARKAGCVGMFGIGGFANLGVCDELTVISQTASGDSGTLTSLTEQQIKAAKGAIPQVATESSGRASPRGTVVVGHLRNAPNPDELRQYLEDFVRYAEERIFFNGEPIRQEPLLGDSQFEKLSPIPEVSNEWDEGNAIVRGRFFEDSNHTLIAQIQGLVVDGQDVLTEGTFRFEAGAIDVFKRGFKLCATKIGTQIGVSGRIDCEQLAPTAGRDSLNAESASLLNTIVTCLERVAVQSVFLSSERIAEHTRVFQYVLRRGMTDQLDKVVVRLADSSEATLESIRVKAEGDVSVFFGAQQKQVLSHIMQARGNVVVLLPADRHKQRAIRTYLESRCRARAFEGIVEIQEAYSNLTRFEQFFLSELETTIASAYEVHRISITPGKLTEDIPVYLREETLEQEVDLQVDVRHTEIMKLQNLGIGPLLRSMVSAFCREYLGPSLRAKSPKFFGSGAINLDWLSKKRSELWVLLKDDIEVISKGTERQVVRSSDIQTVSAGGGATTSAASGRKPRLLNIVGDQSFKDILGYYIRLPEGAVRAYGDLIKECDSRGVVWAGNKMLFVASDAVSSAFQFEVRVDHLILVGDLQGQQSTEGASELPRPLQELNEGLYFPIPRELEPILVPEGDEEVRIEVHCDWIDMKTSKAWQPAPSDP